MTEHAGNRDELLKTLIVQLRMLWVDQVIGPTTSVFRLATPAVLDEVGVRGEEFVPSARYGTFRKMTGNACFANASVAVLHRPGQGYRYGEGFALDAFGMWFHHAFVVDPARRAIEVTWREPARRYLGVAVDVREMARRRGELDRRHPHRGWGSLFEVS